MADDFKTDSERRGAQFKSMLDSPRVMDWFFEEFRNLEHAYRGATHTINRCVADAVSLRREFTGEIKTLQLRCEKLESERDEARAAIGGLQVTLKDVSDRLGKIAVWATKQRESDKEKTP